MNLVVAFARSQTHMIHLQKDRSSVDPLVAFEVLKILTVNLEIKETYLLRRVSSNGLSRICFSEERLVVLKSEHSCF